jgi:hypothetical protein
MDQILKKARIINLIKLRVIVKEWETIINKDNSFMINQNVVHIVQEKFNNNKNKFNKRMKKASYITWILIL